MYALTCGSTMFLTPVGKKKRKIQYEYYTFVESHRKYHTKNEPKYNLWTLGNYDVSE